MQGLKWGVSFYDYPKSVLGPDAAITWEAYLKNWPFRAPIACALHNESSMVSESSALKAPALGVTSGQWGQTEGSHFDDGVRRREAIEGQIGSGSCKSSVCCPVWLPGFKGGRVWCVRLCFCGNQPVQGALGCISSACFGRGQAVS